MRLLMFLAMLLLPGAWAAEPAEQSGPAEPVAFKEGQHYERLALPERAATEDTARSEVAEFFWYGCPHCYTFEPIIEKWLETKPKDVTFVRVPAMLNLRWHLHARAYYALERMGEMERGHALLFAGIHEQNRRLSSEDSISRFLGSHGLDEKAFREAYGHPDVAEKLERAKQLGDQFAISGVPTVIVNGEYMTSARMAGSYEEIIDVVNYLIEKPSDSTKTEENPVSVR